MVSRAFCRGLTSSRSSDRFLANLIWKSDQFEEKIIPAKIFKEFLNRLLANLMCTVR